MEGKEKNNRPAPEVVIEEKQLVGAVTNLQERSDYNHKKAKQGTPAIQVFQFPCFLPSAILAEESKVQERMDNRKDDDATGKPLVNGK